MIDDLEAITPEDADPLAHVGGAADPPEPVGRPPADEIEADTPPPRLAYSLAELRTEIDARWPTRDTQADGSVGDAAHTRSGNDHSPNHRGVVRALDIDVDGIRAEWLAEHIRQLGASGDPRLLDGGYVIFNRRIASEADGWRWHVYTGTNPLTSHVHISVSRDPMRYDVVGGWGVRAASIPPRRPAPDAGLPRHRGGSRVLRLSDPMMRGTDVQDVQRWVGVTDDGVYAVETEAAVKKWQARRGLPQDGVVGPATWASMRIRPTEEPPTAVAAPAPAAPSVPLAAPSTVDGPAAVPPGAVGGPATAAPSVPLAGPSTVDGPAAVPPGAVGGPATAAPSVPLAEPSTVDATTVPPSAVGGPATAPPSVPVAVPPTLDRRFDVVWFGGTHKLTEEVFARLCEGQSLPGRGHYLAMPTALRRAAVEAAGNRLAHYDNASLSGATRGAAGEGAWRRAGHLERVVDAILAHRAQQSFPTPWIFLNEISATIWGRAAGYRRWVVALAERLAEAGLRPVVFSPFKTPARKVDEWRQLGQAGFVAIEGYLDSSRVASLASEQRAGHCRAEYAKMLRAYEAQGVPAARLFLTEHFGHTRRGMAGGPRGRWGIGGDLWSDVIRARAEAAAGLPFAGYVSYAWMYNWMLEEDLVRYADAYVRAVAANGLGARVAAPVKPPSVPDAQATAAVVDDDTRISLMRQHGIVDPELTFSVAREVGLGLAMACALLEKESFGGRHVYGRDQVRNPVKSPPEALLEVTRENYLTYKQHRDAGFGAQGVGKTQLTHPPLQDRADALGGCWKPDVNLRVGFMHLRDLIRRNGLQLGAAMYNGGPRPNATARAYGVDFARRVAVWRRRFGVVSPARPVVRPQLPVVTADTRTFVVRTPHMRGTDVRRWQLMLKRQLDAWRVNYPLAIDGDYGVITRDATATVLFGLGVDVAAIEAGLTPELRAKVRENKLTVAERARSGARGAWRKKLRETHARAAGLSPPLATILSSSWGWHGRGHDGVDLICKPNAPILAICDARVIDVRSGGWWGKSAAASAFVRARGDGIIQLECLVDVGPFKRGLHFGYGHAEKATVRVGQHVKAGDQIGQAGLANAWHIHFMVNRGGTRRGIGDHDPMPYVRYAMQRKLL